MTNKKSNNGSRRNGKNQKYENGIVAMMQRTRNPTAIYRIILTTTGSLGSDGGGVMAGVFTMNPSSAPTWGSVSILYDQFRVIGGQLKMVPRTANNSGAINGIVRFVFDNDTAVTPTSLGDISGYSEITEHAACWTSGVVKVVNFKRPMVRGVVQGQQLWYDEGTPSASPGSLKYYASGLSASITYINWVMDYLVEFQYRSS